MEAPVMSVRVRPIDSPNTNVAIEPNAHPMSYIATL